LSGVTFGKSIEWQILPHIVRWLDCLWGSRKGYRCWIDRHRMAKHRKNHPLYHYGGGHSGSYL